MSRNRFAPKIAAVAGLLLLCAVPGPARADNAAHGSAQVPTPATPGSQKVGTYEDDFAGLDLSDDQKVEIDKVRQETVRRKTIVANDAKLGPEQKDAMIQGYTRLENSQIFRLLTPAQQKVVRQRVMARRAAEQAKKRPARPAPPQK